MSYHPGMALLPPVDLMDRGPRLKRMVVSVLVGLVAGAVAYFIANRIVQPDAAGPSVHVYDEHAQVGRNMGSSSFVMWVTLVSAVVAFTIAIGAQTFLAKKKDRAERGMPNAKVL